MPPVEKTAQDAPRKPEATQLPPTAQDAARAPESGPAEAPAPDPAAASLDHTIAAWLSGHIAGGPIARNTDCWNALWAALPALKAEILKGD